ncbi:hypothetical protein Pint_05626 [Pistacia integerrima]|uniref:Uncharacterized protein n=1 Tax=Pistacia integerrima TaxID=434235 RepID=A0ACC0Z230_9ROSI|nr:hypothetical protein Pint_05626 [Pistacia integerrima]
MSTAFSPAPTPTGVGLGYGIAIAVSILVLISTIMLTSYICIRVKANASSRASVTEDDTISGSSYRIHNSVEPAVLVLGLDGSVVESYPKIVLGESLRLPRPNNGPCSICLSEYLPKDLVRCIPDCHHCFHADCVDEWLKMNATCPLCRSSPAPSKGSTPLATPLSELVPLAFHAR